MGFVVTSVVVILTFVSGIFSGELTFELPDSERQCFYENIEKGIQTTLEFQVIMGGNYDVDMELTAPNGAVLYKDVKKQYDSYTFKTDYKGVYKFCFSNEFSTFTHKVVYFDFQAGDDEPIIPEFGDPHSTAVTQMESSSIDIHQSMKGVSDYQTKFRLREAQGRGFAEDLNERVMIWSIGESVLILIIGIGQVLVLRSFFTTTQDRKMPPTKT